MFTQFLDLLNPYSNLILVIITAAYVVLTGWMVREMRRAREAESESHLVATIVPFDPLNVKLRIHNAGGGPALDIKAVIRLEPAGSTLASTWLHPVLLSGTYEDFLLPGNQHELERIAAVHDKVVVELQWHNIFRRQRTARKEIDLKKLREGWSGIGFLLPPDDLAKQLAQLKDEIARIGNYLDKIETERTWKWLFRQHRWRTNPVFKVWSRVVEWVRKVFRSPARPEANPSAEAINENDGTPN